jgi:hypothetical protein
MFLTMLSSAGRLEAAHAFLSRDFRNLQVCVQANMELIYDEIKLKTSIDLIKRQTHIYL